VNKTAAAALLESAFCFILFAYNCSFQLGEFPNKNSLSVFNELAYNSIFDYKLRKDKE